MKINHILALGAGLGVFAIGTIPGIMAVNNRFPFSILPSIAFVILTLAGFELCHYAFSPADNKNRLFSRGYRSAIFDIISMLLAIGLMIATVIYQPTFRILCNGRLGAGYPAAFICDASGESPLSSVGRVDWADLDSLNPIGAIVDILFYLAIIWVFWKVVQRISYIIIQRTNSRQ